MRDAAPEPGGRAERPARSRIQARNRAAILSAALDEFSAAGFAGVTIDRIAESASLSKPNVLYYFASKEAIHRALLDGLLDLWLAPLRAIDPAGEPVAEILAYVARKLDLSRRYPRESRLFANEILRGAPHLGSVLEGELARLVADKAALIGAWAEQGLIRPVDARHLIFSIWAMTQHYADFEAQVRAVLGPGHDPYAEAGAFLDRMYRRLLDPAES